MEDRIRALETQVGDLREQRATLASDVEHLTKAVNDLTKTVTELRDMLNKGKGAWLVLVLVAGAVGATVSTVFKKVLGIA